MTKIEERYVADMAACVKTNMDRIIHMYYDWKMEPEKVETQANAAKESLGLIFEVLEKDKNR